MRTPTSSRNECLASGRTTMYAPPRGENKAKPPRRIEAAPSRLFFWPVLHPVPGGAVPGGAVPGGAVPGNHEDSSTRLDLARLRSVYERGARECGVCAEVRGAGQDAAARLEQLEQVRLQRERADDPRDRRRHGVDRHEGRRLQHPLSKRDTAFGKTGYSLRDLWTGKPAGTTAKPLDTQVPGHDVLLLRLTPGG